MRVLCVALLAVASAEQDDSAGDDSAGLLQLKQKKVQKHLSGAMAKLTGDSRSCRVFGDPHIKTFDGQRVDCFAPGDYTILESEQLTVVGRYKGNRITKPGIVAAGSLQSVCMSGPLIGGELCVPNLENGRNWLKNALVIKNAGTCDQLRHAGAYFFPDGDRCNAVDLEPEPFIGDGHWKDTCFNKCIFEHGEEAYYADRQAAHRRCLNEDCHVSVYEAKVFNKTTVSGNVKVSRGPGPDLIKCDPPWIDCDDQPFRDTYTIQAPPENPQLKIVIRQGRVQNMGIWVAGRDVLGESPVSGHCGNWNGEQADDVFPNFNSKWIGCPDKVYETMQAEFLAQTLSPPEMPLLAYMLGRNPESGYVAEIRNCDNTMESTNMCNRFFSTDEDGLSACVADCCQDTHNCPDRDNGGAVKVCTAYGDPHIKVFDSEKPKKHFFHPHGDYQMYHSDSLTVQARYSSIRADGKAQISGLAITGPIVGKMGLDGKYPVIEVPLLKSTQSTNLIQSTRKNERRRRKKNKRKPVKKEAVRYGNQSLFTTCEGDNCTLSEDGYFKAVWGRGIKVGNYFDKACETKHSDESVQAELDKLTAVGYTTHGNGWTVCREVDTSKKRSKFTTKNSLTVEFFLGNSSADPIASLVVNSGSDKLAMLLEVNVLLVDPTFSGDVSGHCGNANGDDTDDDFNDRDYVSPNMSLFKEPHPTLGFSEEHRDAGITPFELAKVIEEANDPNSELYMKLTPYEVAEFALWDGTASAFLTHLELQKFLATCDSTTIADGNCTAEFDRIAYRAAKYDVTCHREHPGLDSDDEAAATVIENCVNDCMDHGTCPYESDPEDFDGPEENCPAPNATDAFQACSFWGDPHFQAFFEPGREINYHEAMHSRGRHKPPQRGYNNYKMGLLRLFQTNDKQVEAQAFMCDARGRTTSGAAIAIRRGAKIATFLRPRATGTQAYGNNLHASAWNLSFGLELNIQGVDVDWEDMGPLSATEAHSKSQPSEPNEDWNEAYVQGSWFAQQMFVKDARDAGNSFKPMCLGDVDRSIMVKVSVPKVNTIYEPVVSFQLAKSLVDELETHEGLCMGAEASRNTKDVSYEESLFTVPQLHQLCEVCGMLEDGGKNTADNDGWVSSEEFKGCIHPEVEIKETTGEEICIGVNDLTAALSHCASFEPQSGWHDSCLAEFCNADDDVTGVHAEAKEAANNIKHLQEEVQTQAHYIDWEYADV